MVAILILTSQADYLRNGTGKVIMSLNRDDSTKLWDAVKQHNFSIFNPIHGKLLNPQGVELRNIPMKLYLPHAPSDSTEEEPTPGSLRVLQAPVSPFLSSRTLPFENFVGLGGSLTILQARHKRLGQL